MKKNVFTLSVLTLCTALALTSCSGIEPENISSNKTITIEFQQVDPAPATGADTDTRTEYHESTIWWSKGDQIGYCQYALVNSSMSYKRTYVTLSSSRETASATISSFSTPDEGSTSYYCSYYPHASYEAYSASSGHIRARISTPSVQFPTASSYDPAADLLISDYVENLTQNGEGKYSVMMSYYRQVALGKMRIINLPSTSEIDTVEFSAIHDETDVTLAGVQWYDFTIQGPTSTTSRSYKLSLNYTEQNLKGTDMTAHFCCYPFELDAGDSFTVRVVTKAGEIFTRNVTLSGAQKLSFKAGRGTRFTVDMSTATKNNWLSIQEYNTQPYTKMTNKIYYRVRTDNKTVVSGKVKALSESEFAAITDLETYFESNGTTMDQTSISSMNGSSGYSSLYSYTGLQGDTWYIVVARLELEDGSVGYAVGRIKTDWASLKAESIAGGIRVTYYGKDLHTTNTRNFRVVATDLDMDGKSFAEYYTSVLNPGTISSSIESVNSKNGTSGLYSDVTKHYTDKDTQVEMVAGTNYTAIMKFVNLRGETKILTASANAGTSE